MMHEEFVSLTGINISLTYYTAKIEPLYAAGDEDKQTFCAEWVKRKALKGDTCKALIADIECLDIEIAAKTAKIARLEEQTAEQTELINQWEAKWHRADALYNESFYENERLKSENEQLKHDIDTLESSNNTLAARVDEAEAKAETAAKILNEKDAEILKLKAMLFDLMYRVA